LSELVETTFLVTNYDLAATLTSGQAFRWKQLPNGSWQGVIQNRPILLRQTPQGIHAVTTAPNPTWTWAEYYLQTHVNLPAILETFPKDPPMQAAIRACAGLRLLRQDPWECLASFILSSTKQIVQIKQIVQSICDCYGDSLIPPWHVVPALAGFPTSAKLASLTESQLRSCKMGFRAPYLLKTAQIISSRQLDLEPLRALPTPAAREALCTLPGVGEKIANCVLLFAYGFQDAFPVDVWVQRAITELYFPKRKPTQKRLLHFIQTHFGPNAGYAQQYLFHYMRVTRVEKTAI
jgi:N-glycosylase/DNA lyase